MRTGASEYETVRIKQEQPYDENAVIRNVRYS